MAPAQSSAPESSETFAQSALGRTPSAIEVAQISAHQIGMRLGVLILAGGRSARMGFDKASLAWVGRRAVDCLGDLAMALGAEAVLVSGARDYGFPFVPDEAEDGGPVAGLVAGAKALARRGCDRVLALPVDAPTIKAADLSPLIAAQSPGAAYRDLNVPLVWDLSATPVGAGAGWSIHRFIEAAGLLRVPCPAGADARLRGANTPEEREALLADLAAAGARNPGAG